jgi:hypothetical protein
MTFEPHPREFFAQKLGDLSKAPNRIANLRDKLSSLARAAALGRPRNTFMGIWGNYR